MHGKLIVVVRVMLLMALSVATLIVWRSWGKGPAVAAGQSVHTIIDSPELGVWLIVSRDASLANEDWLALEFENRTGQTLFVDLEFKLEGETFDARTGKPMKSGSLASGQTMDLTGGPRPAILPVGEPVRLGRRLSQDAGNACMTLADHPHAEVDPVRFVGSARVAVRGVSKAGPSWEGTCDPFEFTWRNPNAREAVGLQARLRAMLKEPSADFSRGRALGALLEVQAVAGAIEIQELCEAIALRSQGQPDLPIILQYVYQRRQPDPQLLESTRAVIQAGDRRLLEPLCNALWDDAWAPRLVELFLENPNDTWALRVLDGHADAWKNDGRTPCRLSDAVRRQFPEVFAVRPGEPFPGSPRLIEIGLTTAAMTHDRRLVAEIKPWLDDVRTNFGEREFSYLATNHYLVNLRVCDAAARALTRLMSLDSDFRTDEKLQALHPASRHGTGRFITARDGKKYEVRTQEPGPSGESLQEKSARQYGQFLDYNNAVIERLRKEVQRIPDGF